MLRHPRDDSISLLSSAFDKRLAEARLRRIVHFLETSSPSLPGLRIAVMQDGVDEEPRLGLVSAWRLLVGGDNDLAEAIQRLVFSRCEEAWLVPCQVDHRAGLVRMLRRSL